MTQNDVLSYIAHGLVKKAADEKRRPFLFSDALGGVGKWLGTIGGAGAGAAMGINTGGSTRAKIVGALLAALVGGGVGNLSGNLTGSIAGAPIDVLRHKLFD